MKSFLLKSAFQKPVLALLVVAGTYLVMCSDSINAPTNVPVVLNTKPKERGAKELRVCTQNLFNYNPYNKKKANVQGNALAKRIAFAKCDVVAVQEVLGKTLKKSKAILDTLSKKIEEKTNRSFSSYVGRTHDPRIRNGFLVANDAAKVIALQSLYRSRVPKIDKFGPNRSFIRGPVLLELEVPTKSRDSSCIVTLVVFHLKSKWGYWKDPTKSQYELYRMELAEGLRRLVTKLRRGRKQAGFLLILGDRNSQPNSPSAAILSGRNVLNDFISKNSNLCTTSSNLETKCKPDWRYPPKLVDIFASRFRNFGEKYKVWSYRFKGRGRLYDAIYMPQDEVWVAEDSQGLPTIGVLGKPKGASDHSLLWVDLNW